MSPPAHAPLPPQAAAESRQLRVRGQALLRQLHHQPHHGNPYQSTYSASSGSRRGLTALEAAAVRRQLEAVRWGKEV